MYASEDLADVAAEVAVVEHGDVEAVWPELCEEVCQRAGALGELEPVHALGEGWGRRGACATAAAAITATTTTTTGAADEVPRVGLCKLVLGDVGGMHVLLCEGVDDGGDLGGAVGDADGHEDEGSVRVGVPVGELRDGPGKNGLDHGVEDPRAFGDVDAKKHLAPFPEPSPFGDEPQPVKVHICAREDRTVGWISGCGCGCGGCGDGGAVLCALVTAAIVGVSSGDGSAGGRRN